MRKLLIMSVAIVAVTGCMNRQIEATVTGKDGINGVDGTSCSVAQVEQGAMITCSNGSSTFVSNGINGQNGTDGQNGTNGTDGAAGTSCTVTQVSGGAIVTCGSSQAIINDGTNGGPVGSELIYSYDPCGDASSVFNDEILFIGSKGRVYGYFEDNAASTAYTSQTRRIAYLQPGNYITTDSKSNYCSFTVQPASNYPNIITNEVQH